MAIPNMGEQSFDEVCAALTQLSMNDVQNILHAAAFEVLRRTDCCAGKSAHPTADFVVCFAGAPAAKVLTQVWMENRARIDSAGKAGKP